MSSECRRRTYVALSVLDNLANRLYKSETRGDPGLFLVEFHIKGCSNRRGDCSQNISDFDRASRMQTNYSWSIHPLKLS